MIHRIKRIIARKPYTFHPEDDYLEIVLTIIHNDLTPYVTWLYNKEDDAYYEGHYFEMLQAAAVDFNNRGI